MICYLYQIGGTSNLQSIGLGGNEIHDEGAGHLADALKINTKLKSLGLGGNLIGWLMITLMTSLIIIVTSLP